MSDAASLLQRDSIDVFVENVSLRLHIDILPHHQSVCIWMLVCVGMQSKYGGVHTFALVVPAQTKSVNLDLVRKCFVPCVHVHGASDTFWTFEAVWMRLCWQVYAQDAIFHTHAWIILRSLKSP